MSCGPPASATASAVLPERPQHASCAAGGGDGTRRLGARWPAAERRGALGGRVARRRGARHGVEDPAEDLLPVDVACPGEHKRAHELSLRRGLLWREPAAVAEDAAGGLGGRLDERLGGRVAPERGSDGGEDAELRGVLREEHRGGERVDEDAQHHLREPREPRGGA